MVVTGKMLSLPISDNKVYSSKQFILISMDEWNGSIIMPHGNMGICPPAKSTTIPDCKP